MGLFQRKQAEPSLPAYSLADFEPVIRSSICTGEKVACMRERATGRLHEVLFLRDDADLKAFCRRYGISPEQIKTIY